MNRVILLGFFQKAQTSVICSLLFMLGTSVKFSKLLNSDIRGVPALNTLLKPFKDGRPMGKDL